MKRTMIPPKFSCMLLTDAGLLTLAWYLSYAVRFDFAIPPEYLEQASRALWFLLPIKLGVLAAFGAYRSMWRYISLRDLVRLLQAATVSLLLLVGITAFHYHFIGWSRGIFVLDTVLSLLFLGGVRVGTRTFFLHSAVFKLKNGMDWLRYLFSTKQGHNPTAIVGAGSGIERVLRELIETPELEFDVVAVLTNDTQLNGRAVHGIRILGDLSILPAIIEKHGVLTVLISSAGLQPDDIRGIVNTCEDSGTAFKILPNLGHIINGKVSIKELRDVSYEDLLGRSEVQLDTQGIQDYVGGKTILVSGCGGSIGSELCRQLLRFNPGRLILLDCCEQNLFSIQMKLEHDYCFKAYTAVVGSVQDVSFMDKVFALYQPQVVFHAAAYKHVPLMELNPWEALKNNVVGSYVCMKTAVAHGVQRFVLVSTDKAVRPTNVMGASKRMAELIMHSLIGGPTIFMAVRFGNVLGSSGSVVPLFREQIRKGGPVYVTHPEVTRYFMTIPEASQLILQAGALGEGGEIFILKMGTPVKIAQMARDLIRLSGKEPDVDVKVKFIGLRPGEKLYEELITTGEWIVETRHDKIMVIKPENEMSLCRANQEITVASVIAGLLAAAESHDAALIKKKLQEYVPEYNVHETESVI